MEPSYNLTWVEYALGLTPEERRAQLVEHLTAQLARLTVAQRGTLIIQLLQHRMSDSSVERIIALRFRGPPVVPPEEERYFLDAFPKILDVLKQFDPAFLRLLHKAHTNARKDAP